MTAHYSGPRHDSRWMEPNHVDEVLGPWKVLAIIGQSEPTKRRPYGRRVYLVESVCCHKSRKMLEDNLRGARYKGTKVCHDCFVNNQRLPPVSESRPKRVYKLLHADKHRVVGEADAVPHKVTHWCKQCRGLSERRPIDGSPCLCKQLWARDVIERPPAISSNAGFC